MPSPPSAYFLPVGSWVNMSNMELIACGGIPIPESLIAIKIPVVFDFVTATFINQFGGVYLAELVRMLLIT